MMMVEAHNIIVEPKNSTTMMGYKKQKIRNWESIFLFKDISELKKCKLSLINNI
jgi:hypothetical protein